MSELISSKFFSAKQEAISMGDSLKKMSLEEFFNYYHGKYYQIIDISFMEYFLKIIEHEGEFVISHLKLKEYGVTTSTNVSNIKERMDHLELIEDEDFILKKVKTSKGQKTHRYYLTPDAFKLCLTKAQRHPDNEVDPKIYNQYFILLEKINKLYSIYQSTYSERIITTKDEKIDNLSEKIDKQSKTIDKQSKTIDNLNEHAKEQSKKLDTLLEYTNNLTISTCYLVDKTEDLQITSDCSQEKLDETLEYVKENQRLLKEKSYKSTIDPKDKKLITHFALLKPKCQSDTKTLIIRAQHKHIVKKINELEDTHNVLIPITYNANSITLMNNAKDLYNKMRGAYVKEHNKKVKKRNNKLLTVIEQYNNQIIHHNRKYPDNKKDLRNYTEEKEPILTNETINNVIKFNTTSIVYHDNPYISYDDVIDCIIRMNEETQRDPSDEYDEEDTIETIECVKECIESASTAIKNLPIDTAKVRKGIK